MHEVKAYSRWSLHIKLELEGTGNNGALVQLYHILLV